MVIAVILLVILAMFIVNSVYSLWEEHKKGILCECVGDCSKCKIKCRSNVNYYGTKQIGIPAAERRSAESGLDPDSLPLIIRFIRKTRNIADVVCYWIFNIFGIAYAVFLLSMFIGKIVEKVSGLF